MKVHVIGAGLAGLSAALMAADQGHRVTVVSRGIGGLGLSTGIIDIASWNAEGEPIHDPFEAVSSAPSEHPYSKIGVEAVREGTSWLLNKLDMFDGVPTHNVLIPTSAGAVRPAFGVPKTMGDSILHDGMKLLIVGVKQFKDFPAELMADNLNRSQFVNVTARAREIDLKSRGPESDSTATTYARVFDGRRDAGAKPGSGAFPSDRAQEFARAVEKLVQPGEVVLVPAFLGLTPEVFPAVREHLIAAGAAGVAEVAVAPPSVPGRRIYDALLEECRERRIDVQLNARAEGAEVVDGTITHLNVQRAGRVTQEKVDAVIHAGGGFESGNLAKDSYGRLTEAVFDLPVVEGDDVLTSGIAVSNQMQPIDSSSQPRYSNLYAVGTILAGGEPWAEKSGEGIALGSAWAATSALKGENS